MEKTCKCRLHISGYCRVENRLQESLYDITVNSLYEVRVAVVSRPSMIQCDLVWYGYDTDDMI